MYKSFHIQNFRCFEDLEINDLARINLIAGKNNVGKTSLLEAIHIFLQNYFTVLARLPNEPLAIKASDWSNLFYKLDTTNTIRFSGRRFPSSPQLPPLNISLVGAIPSPKKRRLNGL
jgi:AAA15 family ATPase/GTPase